MKITAKYCEHCNHILHADKYHCAICYSDNLQVKELSGLGEVYSYTKIYAAPKHFADIAPYHIVLVDLEEGLRVTARYNGDNPKIGSKVVFEERQDRAYMFRAPIG